MITDCEKEQIKLRANALDRISTACVVAGVIGPLSTLDGTHGSEWKLFVSTLLYLGAAAAFHHFAIDVLEGFKK